MKLLSPDQAFKLTAAELNRIHKVLRKRFSRYDQGNVLNISFGSKSVGEQQRRCVRFWVRKKRTPRCQSDRIPETVTVKFRMTQSRTWARVRFPTDVVETGVIEPTGEYLVSNDALACSTGVVLEMSREYGGSVFDLIGCLTVAHPFQGMENHRFPVVCQGRTQDGITGEDVAGRVRYRTLHQSFDAAFIESDYPELMAGKYLEDSGIGKEVVTEEEIYQLEGTEEMIHLWKPRNHSYAFAINDYLPETMTPLPFFGHMRGVLMGPGTLDDFEMYSSGSPWTVMNRPVAMQVGWQQTATGEEFGLGQALFAILEEWLDLDPGAYRILNVF